MNEAYINMTAVTAAALLNLVLSMVWYSEAAFGATWSKLAKPAKKKSPVLAYLVNLMSAFVMAYVFAVFVFYLNANTVDLGLMLGFWLWLGFFATTSLNKVVWQGRPWKLYLIDNGYSLISLLITGVILATWS